jgi:hypothetical protein
MTPLNWKREVAIAAAGLSFGLLALPFAIYLVGQAMFGEFGGSGPMALAENIWTDALALAPGAWVLVLGPYVVVQLVRGAIRLWRRAPL